MLLLGHAGQHAVLNGCYIVQANQVLAAGPLGQHNFFVAGVGFVRHLDDKAVFFKVVDQAGDRRIFKRQVGGNVFLVNVAVGVVVKVVDDIGLLLGKADVFHPPVFKLHHQVGKLLHLGANVFAAAGHGASPLFCTKLHKYINMIGFFAPKVKKKWGP